MTLNERRVESKPVYRAATFLPETVNNEERTIELVWSTGARVLRTPWWDDPYYEELAIDTKAIRLERLNNSAPLLDTHESRSLSNQIGKVVRAWVQDGKAHAIVQFRSNKKSLEIWVDVAAGIIRNVSVGYVVHEMTEVRESDAKYTTFRAIDWEPYEISMVPIPADPRSQTRESTNLFPTLIRSFNMPAKVKVGDDEDEPRTRQKEDDPKDPKSEETLTPEPKLDLEKIRTEAIKAERKRSEEIELLCRKAKQAELARTLIAEGITIEEARKRIFDKMVESQPDIKSHVRVQAGDLDEIATRREAIKGALLHRYAPTRFKLEEPAREYRGMSLTEIVRRTLGQDAYGLSKRELAIRAFQSTSDFPMILANVAHQSLLDSYEKLIARQNFQPLVRIVEATDFKPMRKVRLGEIPSLKLVPEGAEITSGTIGEGSEQYSIATYARKFSLTRETIINDDLNAFTDIPAKWGIAAARLENILFWTIFSANQKMSDGKGLFHIDHRNIAAAGSEISEESLEEAELAMSYQQGIDKRDKLNIVPKYLIVPTTLKRKAKKAVMLPIVPTKTEDTNPYAGEYEIIAEPILNDSSTTAWYMAADSSQGVDLIEMAYLDGIREPMVEFREGFDTFGIDIRAALDVGAKAIDYRGFYRNPGLQAALKKGETAA